MHSELSGTPLPGTHRRHALFAGSARYMLVKLGSCPSP